MKQTVSARRLIAPGNTIQYPLLTVEDGALVAVAALTPEEHSRARATHRFPDCTIAATFLDIHIHGGAGHDVMEGTPEAFNAISQFLGRHGVGAFLPTTVTSPKDETLRSLAGITREIARMEKTPFEGAQPIGIHLEGPFLSHAKRGVHVDALLESPSIPLFDSFWQAAEGRIILMTIAPEIPGALELIAHATALGVRCSLGHSNANAAQAYAGITAGAVSATHTFNAMSGLDHRDPGLAAVTLDDDRLYAELIADGFHVDPILMRLYAKSKPANRMLLVTDGISATGMPDGRYRLGDMDVDVVDGRCTSNGTIAGSVLTMDSGIRNFIQSTGVSIETALAAAAANPARLLGKETLWGQVRINASANFVVLSPIGEVVETFIRGIPVSTAK